MLRARRFSSALRSAPGFAVAGFFFAALLAGGAPAPATAAEPAHAPPVAVTPTVTLAQASASGSAAAEANGIVDAYPIPAEVREALAAGDARLALARLQRREEQDAGLPGYYELLGALALKTGDASLAAGALERAVLFRPERAGAWLDLAFAATALGDAGAARAYIEHIETHFSAPPPLRALIASLRTRLERPEPTPLSPRRWRGEASLLAGRDSNANAGLSIDSLSLTLPGGTLAADIAPESRARGDTVALAQAFVHWRRPAGEGAAGEDGPGTLIQHLFGSNVGLEAYALWRERAYANEAASRTRSLLAGGALAWPIAGGTAAGATANLGIQVEQLDRGGSTAYQAARIILAAERDLTLPDLPLPMVPDGWRRQLGVDLDACRVGAGLEAESRRYPVLSALDGQILWLTGQWRCRNSAWGGEQGVMLRLGEDRPNGERPGGATLRTEARALVSARLPYGLRLEGLLYFDMARDRAGYSPLLEDGAARRLSRLGARAELARTIAPGWEALAVIEAWRQHSNLAIFGQRDGSVLAGVRHRF